MHLNKRKTKKENAENFKNKTAHLVLVTNSMTYYVAMFSWVSQLIAMHKQKNNIVIIMF